jgi:hypothetical protein
MRSYVRSDLGGITFEVDRVVDVAHLAVAFSRRTLHLFREVAIQDGPHFQEHVIGPVAERLEVVDRPSLEDVQCRVNVLKLLHLLRTEVPCDEIDVAGRLDRLPPRTVAYPAEGNLGLEVVGHHMVFHDRLISGEGVREGGYEDISSRSVPLFLEVPQHQCLPFPIISIFTDHHPNTAGRVIDVRNKRIAGLHRPVCIVSIHPDLLDLDIVVVLSITRESFKTKRCWDYTPKILKVKALYFFGFIKKETARQSRTARGRATQSRIVVLLPEFLAGLDRLHDFRRVVVEEEQGKRVVGKTTLDPVLSGFGRLLLQSFECMDLEHDVAGVVGDFESSFHVAGAVALVGRDTIVRKQAGNFDPNPLLTDRERSTTPGNRSETNGSQLLCLDLPHGSHPMMNTCRRRQDGRSKLELALNVNNCRTPFRPMKKSLGS